MVVAAVLGAAAAVPAASAALLRWRAAPSRSFPKPLGPRSTLVAGRVEIPVPGGSITAQVFRPAQTASGELQPARYYRSDALAALAQALNAGAARHVVSTLFHFMLGWHTHPDPTLKEGEGSAQEGALQEGLPLLIFSHGLFGNCDMYTQLCRELASYGCVVVALEHQDGTATGTTTVPYRRPPAHVSISNRDSVREFRLPFLEHRRAELLAAIQYLTAPPAEVHPLLRGCDVSRLICAGHSFGAASMVFAAEQVRPALLLLYDTWATPLPAGCRVPSGIPVVNVLSEQFAVSPLEAPPNREAFEPEEVSYIPGTSHQLWSDFTWFLPQKVNPTLGKTPKRDAHRTWVQSSFAALDRVLGGATQLAGEGAAAQLLPLPA
eukprot:TRINITY_DN6122_c0_g1_i1.p1 TRINITY_DN6122_c0_g1~~TRINITY_DN6122_c0_g1_i1.p1  ORF type:complete len:405 (+),score=136.08 TRINITY_DN6122_c0_g1_i1:79-1215(+)